MRKFVQKKMEIPQTSALIRMRIINEEIARKLMENTSSQKAQKITDDNYKKFPKPPWQHPPSLIFRFELPPSPDYEFQ